MVVVGGQDLLTLIQEDLENPPEKSLDSKLEIGYSSYRYSRFDDVEVVSNWIALFDDDVQGLNGNFKHGVGYFVHLWEIS
jgi:hypothetical protein